MDAIFISYRREDSQGEAGRLSDSLAKIFGDSKVFLDVEGIQAGQDFRQAIETQVASCSVLLALIGPHWLDSTAASGQRRLDDPHDFVRLEISSALKRGIPVIPVLVRQAQMVTSEQLPPDLSALAFRQAAELRYNRWDADVAALAASLRPRNLLGIRPLWIGSIVGAALIGAAFLTIPARLRPPAPASNLTTHNGVTSSLDGGAKMEQSKLGSPSLGGPPIHSQISTSVKTSPDPEPGKENALPPPLESKPPSDRQNISLVYYRTGNDPARLELGLQKLGFRFSTAVPNSKVLDVPINAIWCGSNVSESDVQEVATTMLNAGVNLRAIKPFASSTRQVKASSIEVGRSAESSEWPVLGPDSIRKAAGNCR